MAIPDGYQGPEYISVYRRMTPLPGDPEPVYYTMHQTSEGDALRAVVEHKRAMPQNLFVARFAKVNAGFVSKVKALVLELNKEITEKPGTPVRVNIVIDDVLKG
jgi:hypothetical protein